MADEKREKYSSIFDAVSKMERKKALKKVLREEPAHTEKEKLPLLTDEQIAQKLEEYQKLHNLLADSLEKVYVKNNLSPRQLRDYFNTPQNFTGDQWSLIQNEKEKIEQMLARLMPFTRGKVEETEKGKQKRPQKMQVKSRWMPMH